MKIFQKIASSVIGLSLLTIPGVSAKMDSSHDELRKSLNDVGVKVILNETDLCDGSKSGMYSPDYNAIIICQDDRIETSDQEVEWTENDYDTLRHEAQHVVQDCMEGINNQKMSLFFDDRIEYLEFVVMGLTKSEFFQIVESYRSFDNDIILNELEAFVVAKNVKSETIASAVRGVCKK
jgi:hypothetical protein